MNDADKALNVRNEPEQTRPNGGVKEWHKLEEEEKGLWYFAHPYTCQDENGNYVAAGEEANFRICNYRAGRLLAMGYNIYSPISHTHPIHLASPLFLSRHEHEMWYHLDLEVIQKTHFEGIILAPKWETSKGCRMEKKTFEEMGMIILLYETLANAEMPTEI